MRFSILLAFLVASTTSALSMKHRPKLDENETPNIHGIASNECVVRILKGLVIFTPADSFLQTHCLFERSDIFNFFLSTRHDICHDAVTTLEFEYWDKNFFNPCMKARCPANELAMLLQRMYFFAFHSCVGYQLTWMQKPAHGMHAFALVENSLMRPIRWLKSAS